MTQRLSVPGNLLFAGEYAVLEEGGLGLAVAAEPRAQATVQDAPMWSMVSRFNNEEMVWTEGSGPVPPLLDAVFQETGRPLNAASLTLDTRVFSREGKKSGLGSSAAAAVALTALVLAIRYQKRPGLADIFLHAVRAHRRFQKGRGSGYDVAASLFGGTGLFTGGLTPHWQPVTLRWLGDFGLHFGESEVKTPFAVQSYQSLKYIEPILVENYLSENNRLLPQLISAGNWTEAQSVWASMRTNSVALGTALGQNAELPPSLRWADFAKALGAGNELFAVFAPSEDIKSHGLQPMKIAQEGLRWEE